MNMIDENTPKKQPFYAMYFTLASVAVLILAKAYAYYESGSVSVLSSLTDSALDFVISIVTLASLYYASRPADHDHRWGHGKMQAVSALFEAALIAGGSAFVLFEALHRFSQPVEWSSHPIALIVMVLSLITSVMVVFVQKLVTRSVSSLAVDADSAHYSGDILVNAGTILVLFLGGYGAPVWLDPLFATIVSFVMFYVAWGIARKSLDMLLDREISAETRDAIIAIIEKHKGVQGWHDLRTHKNGEAYVMSFDIEVDPDLRLYDAHEIAKDLEDEILEVYPDSEILIHIDPVGYIEDARHRIKGVHH